MGIVLLLMALTAASLLAYGILTGVSWAIYTSIVLALVGLALVLGDIPNPKGPNRRF